MHESRWFLVAASILVAALTVGCTNFTKLDEDLKEFSALIPIRGEVVSPEWSGDPIVLVLMRQPKHPGMPIEIVRRRLMRKPSPYEFRVDPGIYMLGAFEDGSGDERLQIGQERVGLYRNMEPVDLTGGPVGERFDIVITDEVPEILRDPDLTGVDKVEFVTTGEVIDLADPRFGPDTGPFGMWQPLSFVRKYGTGILMLEPYDAGRIPVLFVHGISGYPREFEYLIGQLDQTQYQAWVAQYPSGWKLGEVAEFLDEQCERLKRLHDFSEMALVAYSMGGLVSRQLLKLHGEHHATPYIKRFVTVASPLGGMASADRGVGMAPSVVPAWRDLGPKSDFIKDLYAQPLNPQIAYSLFFAYGGGSVASFAATDGVVPLAVQLRREAQLEASRSFGFDSTHTGVLKLPATAESLNLVLKANSSSTEGR